MYEIKNIRIEWIGPYSLEDIGYDFNTDTYNSVKNSKLNNEDTDYGIYQVYGYHPIYGNDVLLYIGKAQHQTFSKRLAQEGWEYNTDYKNIKFYIGRFFDKEQVSDEEWDKQIDLAEKMLIFAHEPARNSSNIKNVTKNHSLLKEFENIRIFNYNAYRSLMPEISGELWLRGFEDFKGVFGSEALLKN
ncbi:hypothetical protein [Hydrogenimonas sp.]